MDRRRALENILHRAPSPCFVVDEALVRRNCEILRDVQERTGCKIMLALKAFSMFSLFPLIREYLVGVCASSPHEARLGREEFGREVHTFAAAFTEADVRDIVTTSDHIVFNSFGQLERFRPIVERAERKVGIGLRVNPEHSEGAVPIYDPCSPGSRLGIRRAEFEGRDLAGIEGLHFHNLCEQNADSLERTLAAFEKKFGEFVPDLEYVNFGGGHHITREDYDVELLVKLVSGFQQKYGVQVYLEPGEAVVLNAGYLVSTILDLTRNDMDIAIMDACVPAHMPDVIEMPYRPHITGSGRLGEKPHGYRIGGLSCLAGDVAGEYAFDAPLQVGSKIVFTDMALYTMVKTNHFNGVQHPAIAILREDGELDVVREFGYADFRNRLS